jgi:glycosyltransferase involved in cell wall biosynthesis
MSAPVCRALRVPIVWHKVDLAFDRKLAGPLSRLCTGVIPVGEAVAAAVPPTRVIGFVPPPVRFDESFVVGDPRPAATLGSIGRLVSHKGHHHVIEAARRLLPRFPEIRVVIVGSPVPYEPGYQQELHELGARSGLGERIELVTYVDRIETVLERLTVLVSATYREDREGSGFEGLPTTVLEAGWAGLPVVATSGGGTAEAMRDGVTGTLVPPEDPDAIAAAVARYLEDPQAASAAGRAGSAFVREHFRSADLSARLFTHLAAVSERRRARRAKRLGGHALPPHGRQGEPNVSRMQPALDEQQNRRIGDSGDRKGGKVLTSQEGDRDDHRTPGHGPGEDAGGRDTTHTS